MLWWKLRRLSKLLESYALESYAERAGAISEFRQIGEPAVPRLIRALRESESELGARGAAEALGEIGSSQAIPALVEALGHSSYTVRLEAAIALARIGAPAVETLLATLRDGEELTRGAAAEALLRMARRTEYGVTTESIASSEVVQCLGSPSATSVLVRALQDSHYGVREHAAELLGMLRPPDALRALVASYRSMSSDEVSRARALEIAIKATVRDREESLAEAVLRDVIDIPDVKTKWAQCNFGDSHDCDFHQERQRARQELIRRGLRA